MVGVKNKLLDIRLEMKFKDQGEFAQFLEIDITQYNKYENNKKQPNLKTAIKISEKINKNVNDIFYLVDE